LIVEWNVLINALIIWTRNHKTHC